MAKTLGAAQLVPVRPHYVMLTMLRKWLEEETGKLAAQGQVRKR